MHPAHPTVRGYLHLKEAGINEILQSLGGALSKGNFKGIPTEYLTAGGGGLLAALLGALMSPNNRVMGALGGGLLGGGLGYLGGYYGGDKLKSWGSQLAQYGKDRHMKDVLTGGTAPANAVEQAAYNEANPIRTGQTIDGKPVYGPDMDPTPKAPGQLTQEDLLMGPRKTASLKLKLALASN